MEGHQNDMAGQSTLYNLPKHAGKELNKSPNKYKEYNATYPTLLPVSALSKY